MPRGTERAFHNQVAGVKLSFAAPASDRFFLRCKGDRFGWRIGAKIQGRATDPDFIAVAQHPQGEHHQPVDCHSAARQQCAFAGPQRNEQHLWAKRKWLPPSQRHFRPVIGILSTMPDCHSLLLNSILIRYRHDYR